MMFTVYGNPVPQGSKKAFVRGGRAIVTEAAGAKHKHWRASVSQTAGEYAAQHGLTPLDEPCAVRVVFFLDKPKSAPKFMGWASKQPDIDKLLRAVLDGITGSILKDDARVVILTSEKRYALNNPPGAVIQVMPLGALEREGVFPPARDAFYGGETAP